MAQDLYLGVDVGTTAIKAAAYTAEGQQVAMVRESVAVRRPREGWCELPMNDVWQAVLRALRGVVGRVDSDAVCAIGVCGQGDGLWMLDADMQPVRDAILWNDARASDLVQGWTEDGTSDAVSRFSRTAIWPGTNGAALRWIAENEPEALTACAHIMWAKDWIVWKLTGRLGTDYSDATIPFLDLESRRFAPEVFEALGLPDLRDRLPDIFPATAQAGDLTAGVGLPPVPVARGALDLAAMMTGLGLEQPGDMCLILGTTAVVSYVMPPEPFGTPPLAATVHHPFADVWIRVLAPQSGASAFDWFAALHPNSFGGLEVSEVVSRINELARDVPPGANGVMFLPFLTGERAPFVAPGASASFIGMRAHTSKADMARAVMEGAAYSLRHCLHAEGAPTPERVALTGGGARNRLWCQIVADVLGTTILANSAEDHGLWGAALIGGISAGQLEVSAARRDEDFAVHTPDPEAYDTYTRQFGAYLKAVEASRAIWAAMRTAI